MRSWTIAFTLGVCLALRIPYLPATPSWLWPGLMLLVLMLPCTLSHGAFRLPLTSAWLLGLLWALQALAYHQQRLLPAAFEQRDVWLQGRVHTLSQQGVRSERFVFQAAQRCLQARLEDCAQQDWEAYPRRLLLTDYSALHARPGERWQWQVRLKRPHGSANPGTFDYEAWLWQQRIAATGYVRSNERNQRLSEAGWSRLTEQWRQQLGVELTALAQEHRWQQPALIAALGFGDRQGISDADWALFSLSGTNHLMVISGLHIGFVATLCFLLSRWLWSRSARAVQLLPAPQVAAAAAIAGAVFYAALAGFSLPTQRACIMVAALMAGRLLCRHTNALNSLALALLLVLVLDPLAPLSAGFWLSFGAVALLLYFVRAPRTSPNASAAAAVNQDPGAVQHLRRLTRSVLLTLQAQWVLAFGLLPLMLIHFQQHSSIAPLVNLVAIPLVGLLIVPLVLLGIVLLLSDLPLSDYPLGLADLLLNYLMDCLVSIQGQVPGALLMLPALPPIYLLMLLCATACLLMPLRPWVKLIASVGFAPLLFPHYQPPLPGELRLHVLDVGQGQAVIIETHEHTLIYDAGPAFSERFNAGSGIIVPFLRAANMPPPRWVIISHGDNDHNGGALALQTAFPEAEFIAADSQRQPASLRFGPCQRERRWRTGGIEVSILHPSEADGRGNNQSCVLSLQAGDMRVLLPGDIEASAESQLVRERKQELAAQILLAPHHGSKTSSTPTFVTAVDPTWVLVSSGYRNRYGHPAQEVRERYLGQGARVLNSADGGAIQVEISAQEGISVSAYRQREPRVWR